MRVEVDLDKCTRHGICESIADDVFEVQDDGSVLIDDTEPPDSDRERMQQGVTQCPAAAATVVVGRSSIPTWRCMWHRIPDGEWIDIRAETSYRPDGIRYNDRHAVRRRGAVGSIQQSVLVRRPPGEPGRRIVSQR